MLLAKCAMTCVLGAVTALAAGGCDGLQFSLEPQAYAARNLPYSGLLVSEVRAGSAAESAGFAAEDVVYAVDGVKVRNLRQLESAVKGTGRRSYWAYNLASGSRREVVCEAVLLLGYKRRN